MVLVRRTIDLLSMMVPPLRTADFGLTAVLARPTAIAPLAA
jgi:hypothetical protein